MVKKISEIEQIKLFVAQLINDEQSKYSDLVRLLNANMSNSHLSKDILELLRLIYEAKDEVLQKVYRKIGD